MQEIIDSIPALKELMNVQMKGALAYQIARIATAVEKEYNLYNEERNKVVLNGAIKDEKGEIKRNEDGTYNITKECNDELNEMLNVKVQIPCSQIKISDFETLNQTPSIMMAMIPFIKE